MGHPISRFADDFMNLCRTQPDAIAVIDGLTEQTISYRQLAQLLDRTETFLRQSGAVRGKPVTVILNNCLEAYLVILTCFRHGYDLSTFASIASVPETVAWMRTVGSSVLVAPEGVDPAVQAAAQDQGVAVAAVPTDGLLAWLPDTDGAAPEHRAARLLLTTSGTTGKPKAMVIDMDTLWSAGKAFARFHSFLDGNSRFLNNLPMSYLGGIFNLGLIPMASGGSTVIVEAFSGKSFFNLWQTVERFDVNMLWLVPTIARGLLQLEQKTGASKGPRKKIFARIRAAFIGTAPVDLKIKREFEEVFGIRLLENYALSETTFLTSETLYGGERADRSVGAVLPYVEMRLAPIVGGEDGPMREIEVKTPYLFLGYAGEDGTITPPVLHDGYFRTQDLGRLNEDNALILGGRTRDIIKKGGYLVGLREIELVAESFAGVAEAVAVGVAHDFYGEDYILFVNFHPDVADTATALAELRAFITTNVAKQKWPAKVTAVADIPRTSTGKVRKHLLLDTLAVPAVAIADLP